MTLRDAADWSQAQEGRDRIMNDPNTGLLEKSRLLAQWSLHADRPAPQPRRWTLGDVLHGAMGAAMGAGVARGVSSTLGLSPRLADKLETAGMGVGAAMNTGVIKRAQVGARVRQLRKHAFRLGAVKGLLAAGYFGQQAKTAAIIPLPVISLDPASLFEIPKGLAHAATSAGSVGGTAAGLAGSVDEDEEEIARLQAQRVLLEDQIERVRAERRNRVMRQLFEMRRRTGDGS